MKKSFEMLMVLVLTFLMCFPVSAFLDDPEEQRISASIDPCVLPEYIEGEDLTSLGFTKRLTKYDTTNSLNIVGFETEDGNEMVKLFPMNVKYVKNNQVIDKSAKLVRKRNGWFSDKRYMFENISNDFELSFPKDILENPLKIENDNNSILISPIKTSNLNAASLVDNTTVEYSTENSLFKIKSNISGVEIIASDTGNNQIQKYAFELKGFEPKVIDDGTVILESEQGKKYAISAFEDNDDAVLDVLTTFESEGDGKFTLSVNSTSYTINVTEVSQSIIADAPVYSFFNSHNLGNYSTAVLGTNSPYDVGRMYVKFDLSALSGISYDRIISAYYRVYKFGTNDSNKKMDAYLVKEAWQENTITWDNKPDYFNERLCTTNSSESNSIMYSGERKSDFYITQAVQAWLQGVENNGILIKERNDSGTVNYIQKEGSGSHPYCLNVLYATESFSSRSIGIQEGKYYIKSKINNMLMTASGSQVVQQNLLANPASQVWYLEYEGNGYYTISPMSDRTKVVKNTSNISLINANYSNYALWKIRRNWDGSFSIMNKESNDTKNISAGANYSIEGQPLIYGNDSMGLDKFDDWTFIPAQKGDANIFSFSGNNSSVINTEQGAVDTKGIFNSLGYNSTAYNNKEASFALSKMPSSDLFIYYGHGESGCLGFIFEDSTIESGLNETYLTGGPTGWIGDSNVSTVQSLSYNALYNQMLTLYDACLAGRDMPQNNSDGKASSLIGMTYFRGSHYTVGFMNETYTDFLDLFNEMLYPKLAEGMTIYEAFDYVENNLEEYILQNNKDEQLIYYYNAISFRTWLGDNSIVYNLPDYQ